MATLNLSWFDFVVVALLGFGLWRGRKRGMTQELLDIIKWVFIVLIAGFFHEPLGRLLLETTSIFSPLGGLVMTYLTLALVVTIIFSFIRRGAGEKLTGSDVFGSSEYYLGMMSGVARYACIILVAMSFLNARQYSQEEVRASVKYQEDNFGSTFFLTLPDLQQEVFTRSFSGKFVREYLSVLLIRSTPSGAGELNGDNNVAKARAR